MQDHLPFVVVNNLAASASFYSAVVHPLGLRYISASGSSILFGDDTKAPPTPVFEVRLDAPKPTCIVFSAASPDIVKSFHSASLRANPDLVSTDTPEKNLSGYSYLAPDGSNAKVSDLEGNIMEVVYVNPPDYPDNYSGGTVRRTQSTNDEVSRILDWNLDVATSQPAKSVVARSSAPRSVVSRAAIPRSVPPTADDARTMIARRASRACDDAGGEIVHRKWTQTTTTKYAPVPEPTKVQEGYSTNTIIGAALGAAAAGLAVGGAITYFMMRGDEEKNVAPPHHPEPPQLIRRSTYSHPSQTQGFVEVERPHSNRYPVDEYGGDAKKYPPSAAARYGHGGPHSRVVEDLDDGDRRSSYTGASRSRRRSEVSSSRKPLLLADTEHRSVVGSTANSKHTIGGQKLLLDHAYRSDSGSEITPSQADGLFKPVDYEIRSRAPSKAPTMVSAAPSRHTSGQSSRRSSVSRRHHESSEDDHHSRRTSRHGRPAEIDSFVSAHNQRSASTARPAEQRPEPKRSMYTGEHGAGMDRHVGNILANEFDRVRNQGRSGRRDRDRHEPRDDGRSHAPSAATAVKTSPKSKSRAPSRAPSVATTAVPRNPFTDSHAIWDDDDDDGRSVAPDDSISCIGTRRSRRG